MPSPLDPDCIFDVLEQHAVEYVLIGGLAAVLRGSTVMTNDADIVPANSPANLSRLSEALWALDAKLRAATNPDGVDFDPHPALLHSMAMLNLHTRCGDLDVAFTPAAIDDYTQLVAASNEYEINGHTVRVASLADIIRSKEAAGRAKDYATLPVLYALREEIAAQAREAAGPGLRT